MNLNLIQDSAVEPLSIREAKTHLRVFDDQTDEEILSLIKAARQYIETYCSISLIEKTWELSFDVFSNCIEIPEPNLIEVVDIKYLDSGDNEQTLDESVYRLDKRSKPARIFEARGESWPDTLDFPNAVRVTFTAGFGASSDDVPMPIKQAIKLLIGHWNENGGAMIIGVSAGEMAFSVDALLAPYKYKAL